MSSLSRDHHAKSAAQLNPPDTKKEIVAATAKGHRRQQHIFGCLWTFFYIFSIDKIEIVGVSQENATFKLSSV